MTSSKKIVVTGGAGYIGSHTIIELVNGGYTPVVIDNLSNSKIETLIKIRKLLKVDLKFYQIDCTNYSELLAVFLSEPDIEAVIHLASFKSVSDSVIFPLEYYKNNVTSLLVLLEVMNKTQKYNLVYSSSCAVYGDLSSFIAREDSPSLFPKSPYGNTKKICEEILFDQYNSNSFFRTIVLRYFNPIGIHTNFEIKNQSTQTLMLFDAIMEAAVSGAKPLTIYGDKYNTKDGTCIRDYIDVRDIARANVKAIQKIESILAEESYFNIFNIGKGKGYSVFEILEIFEAISGIKIPFRVGLAREGDIAKIYADVKKSNDVLAWKAKESLSSAIEDFWEKKLQKV